MSHVFVVFGKQIVIYEICARYVLSFIKLQFYTLFIWAKFTKKMGIARLPGK